MRLTGTYTFLVITRTTPLFFSVALFSQFYRDKIRKDLLDCREIKPTPLPPTIPPPPPPLTTRRLPPPPPGPTRKCMRRAPARRRHGDSRVDVVFVLDSSNSIGHDNYADALNIIVEFVKFIQQVIVFNNDLHDCNALSSNR